MTNTISLALKDLDSLLRGEATKLSALQRGRIEVETGRIPWLILALGLFYGACMGCFALANKQFGEALLQTISTMGKVPVLFFATLLVTFPSLYIFNALVGSRLTLVSVWRLLISSLVIMMAVLASMGPIVAFFSLSTTSAGYSFMLLLNVAVFGLAGFLGLKFLLHTLHRLTVVLYENTTPENTAPGQVPGALDRVENHAMGAHVRRIFGLWVIVFGLVGAQMSWVLRPFVSAPDHAFVLFSPRGSNFFSAVFDIIGKVLSGH